MASPVFEFIGTPLIVLSGVFFFVLGAVFGSFMNCVAWRLVAGENPWKGHSHCTTCGHQLGALALIPILSWCLSRGKCRHCGDKVSPRYLVTEALCGVVFLAIFLRFGFCIETVAYCALCVILLGLSLVDLDTMTIPNGFHIAGIIVFTLLILAAAVSGDPGQENFNGFGPVTAAGSFFSQLVGSGWLAMLLDGLVGGVGIGVLMLVFALIFDKVLGRESLGGGDVKLLFVVGLFLGLPLSVLNLIVACVLGLGFNLLCNRGEAKPADAKAEPAETEAESAETDADTDDTDADGASAKEELAPLPASSKAFPFGPAIAASCVLCLIFGVPALEWYLGLFL